MSRRLSAETVTLLLRGTDRGDCPSPSQPCPSHPPQALSGLGRTWGYLSLLHRDSKLLQYTTNSWLEFTQKGKINSGVRKQI